MESIKFKSSTKSKLFKITSERNKACQIECQFTLPTQQKKVNKYCIYICSISFVVTYLMDCLKSPREWIK